MEGYLRVIYIVLGSIMVSFSTLIGLSRLISPISEQDTIVALPISAVTTLLGVFVLIKVIKEEKLDDNNKRIVSRNPKN